MFEQINKMKESEMWGYVLGGATVFGAIMAVTAFVNSRLTRREITRVIVEETKQNRKILESVNRTQRSVDETLKSVDETLRKLSGEHVEIIESLKQR